jgi:hypothetical protein
MAMDPRMDERFTAYLADAAKRAQREAGYNPTLFRQMLASDGGYHTAVILLTANRLSDGFEKLWEKGRLDLTVEALILQPEWFHQFAPELRAIAQKRLRDVGFPVPSAPQNEVLPPHHHSGRYWVLYHKQHEAPFGGDCFYCKRGPQEGDHAFVVLGDKPRNTSYFLDGEYSITQVDPGPVQFNGKSYNCRLQLSAIAKPTSPLLLNEAVGVDLVEFRDRHASGTGIRPPDERTLSGFKGALAGWEVTSDERSTDIADLTETGAAKTTIQQQIDARLGQGKFRQVVVSTWGIGERCALTGTSVRDMLTASHIIPWAEDETLRLEGTNGLLLCAHVDRLFDRHLISFGSEGKLTGSARLNADGWEQLGRLGIKLGMQLKTVRLNLTAQQLILDRLGRHRARMHELDKEAR